MVSQIKHRQNIKDFVQTNRPNPFLGSLESKRQLAWNVILLRRIQTTFEGGLIFDSKSDFCKCVSVQTLQPLTSECLPASLVQTKYD